MAADEPDIVESWSSLMEEWACASKELDAALAMSRSNDPATLAEGLGRVEDARRHQDHVRQRLDALIRDAMMARTSPTDSIIVGRLSRANPEEPESSPDGETE